MLLSDRDLQSELDSGELVIDPFDSSMVQPASIDVRLSSFFRIFNNNMYTHIDPSIHQEDLTVFVEVETDKSFLLHPGEFVLGSSLETITLSASLAGRLEGKSSLGRLGLCVHSTAGFIDPGFTGSVTLELSNIVNLPIALHPGMRIGQLAVFRLSSASVSPYGSAGLGSRYQGQQGPTESKSYLNF